MTTPGLPREPGWYQLTETGWDWLAPPETQSRDLPGDPLTLVLAEKSDYDEAPLW